METTADIDTARLGIMLNELRLPTIKTVWSSFAEQADKEGWPAARFLSANAEHELAERDRRRIERHLAEARFPSGKTLDTFDFEAVPMISKAQVMAVGAGDAWLENGANLLLFEPPGGACQRLRHAERVLEWQAEGRQEPSLFGDRSRPRRERLEGPRHPHHRPRPEAPGRPPRTPLEASVAKLDSFDLLILDDLAYVTEDQAETNVLFELISARCEQRSMMITANQPFGEWSKVFPDPAMTLAAIDRLVHHATIFEMNFESYRRRVALERKRGPGRPPSRATPKTTAD